MDFIGVYRGILLKCFAVVSDKKSLTPFLYVAFREWINLEEGTIWCPLPNVRSDSASSIAIKRILQERCPVNTRFIHVPIMTNQEILMNRKLVLFPSSGTTTN